MAYSRQDCIILMEMLMKKKMDIEFNFKNQKIINSEALFRIVMNNLESDDLVRKHFRVSNRYRHAFYDLTYSGEFLAIWITRCFNTPTKYKNIDDRELNYVIG